MKFQDDIFDHTHVRTHAHTHTFGFKLLHAHLQYVCNIPAKYQMNILKALGDVNLTKYELLPISQYVQ